MIDVEIESTGRRLTLKKSERIRITYQAADFADAGSGKGSFSTSFVAPMTSENIETLGFSSVVNVRASLSPYKNIKARLLDGSNEIDRGFLRIDNDEITGREISLTFLGRNVDWFSSIGENTLQDLDLSRFDHIVNADNVNTSRNEGYVYLPVDYGNLDNRNTATININEIFPAIFIKDIVKQIFKDLGYKIRGSLLKRPDYNRMVIPYNGLEPKHSQQWVNDRTVYVSSTAIQVIGNAIPEKLILNDTSKNHYVTAGANKLHLQNSRIGNFGNARYTADEPMVISVLMLVTISFSDYFSLQIRKNGIVQNTFLFYKTAYLISLPITLDTGEYLEVWAIYNGIGTIIEYRNASDPDTNNRTSYIGFIPSNSIALNSTIQISQFLPDLKQKDLIEYLFFAFGIIPNFDKSTNSVVFDTISDLNIVNYEDWTGKVDFKQEIERDYFDFVSKYCRKNFCRYDTDSDDFLLEQYKNTYNEEYGQGSIDIDNDYLEGSQEFYTAPFAPTRSRNVFQGVPNLNMFLPFIPQNDNPIPRILLYAPDVSISDLTNGIISSMVIVGRTVTHIPYSFFVNPTIRFIDPIGNQHLGFGDPLDLPASGKSILENNYSKLIRVLNQPLVMRPSLRISALEAATVRYDKLKYIEELGGYYYLNKIGQYDGSGEPTECELIKWY